MVSFARLVVSCKHIFAESSVPLWWLALGNSKKQNFPGELLKNLTCEIYERGFA